MYLEATIVVEQKVTQKNVRDCCLYLCIPFSACLFTAILYTTELII